MKTPHAITMAATAVMSTVTTVVGFSPSAIIFCHNQSVTTSKSSSTRLNFFGGGSGAKDLDEEWERQQELLQLRRASLEDRDKYFQSVEDRRIKISEEQKESEKVWVDERKDKDNSSGINPLSNLFGGSGGGDAKVTATTLAENEIDGEEEDTKSKKNALWPF